MDAKNQQYGVGDDQPSSGQTQGRRHPSRSSPLDNLTDEEKAVLKECEKDSFYYRALPLSAGSMVGVQYLIKTGRLAPHPRFGSIPKSIIFGFFGYMIGKISYLPVCRKKVLEQIPHSKLAATITGEKSPASPSNESDNWDSQPMRKSNDEFSSFSKIPSGSGESTIPSGIDDRFRPTVDKEGKPADLPEEGQKRSTYEDMRRRNRQQYEDSKAPQPPKAPGAPTYKDSPLMPQKPWKERQPRDRNANPNVDTESLDSPPLPSQAPTKKKRTNMWGDVIED